VAEALGVDVADVLVQGYANDYAGYLTTPEEYDAQRYEGGHTMFGRWQLPAYQQEVDSLACDLRDGVARTSVPPRLPVPRERRRRDPPLRCSGVALPPGTAYAPGDEVRAEFGVTPPGGELLPAYCVVERQVAGGWARVADDGDWSTTIEWRHRSTGWVAAVTWLVPPETGGTFRISYVDAETSHPTAAFTVG
jgi:neutral ceramidase